MIANPGPSCEEQRRERRARREATETDYGFEWGGDGGGCMVDGKKLSQMAGALLLATGGILAIVGITTATSRSTVRQESSEPVPRTVPACRRLSAEGIPVMLTLSDGSKLVAAASLGGQARFAVGDEHWARDSGVLRATVSVEGRPVREILLSRDIQPRGDR
jgi:hypothetical protein